MRKLLLFTGCIVFALSLNVSLFGNTILPIPNSKYPDLTPTQLFKFYITQINKTQYWRDNVEIQIAQGTTIDGGKSGDYSAIGSNAAIQSLKIVGLQKPDSPNPIVFNNYKLCFDQVLIPVVTIKNIHWENMDNIGSAVYYLGSGNLAIDSCAISNSNFMYPSLSPVDYTYYCLPRYTPPNVCLSITNTSFDTMLAGGGRPCLSIYSEGSGSKPTRFKVLIWSCSFNNCNNMNSCIDVAVQRQLSAEVSIWNCILKAPQYIYPDINEKAISIDLEGNNSSLAQIYDSKLNGFYHAIDLSFSASNPIPLQICRCSFYNNKSIIKGYDDPSCIYSFPALKIEPDDCYFDPSNDKPYF